MPSTNDSTFDDAADTLRFRRFNPALEVALDPDATSIYDLREPPPQAPARGRAIRTLRRDIEGLRMALAAGWDVGPELEHEERRLAEVEGVTC